MTKLRDLDAKLIRYEERGDDRLLVNVETLAEAQGVMFLCPKCYAANGNSSIGTHSVVCWSRSRGAPELVAPLPGRWAMEGTSLDDLTLNADPPGTQRSVLLTGEGCQWHGFVNNGDAA